MATVAIIPARGGSKRIRHKNVKELWGKPLIVHTIEAAQKAECVDLVVVSTENALIREIALGCGACVIDRPESLAADDTKTEPVMLHAVEELERRGEKIDNVMLLQPTSPLRDAEDIDRAFEQFRREKADSLLSVTEKYHFYWKDGKPLNYSIDSYDGRPPLKPGAMDPFLQENGAIYIIRRDLFMQCGNRIGGRISTYRMSEDKEIDIDTPADWQRLLRQKKVSLPGRDHTYIIAEIGCNHMGDVDIAKRMIEVAHYCGVDAVKLQKRDNKTYLTPEQYNKSYEGPNSFGRTYGEHREFLELSVEEHAELKDHAESLGLTYFVSVWDKVSAAAALEMGMPLIKIPSACITDKQMLAVLNESTVPILASCGMSTLEEIDDMVAAMDRVSELYLFHCTSTYPCAFRDLNLNVIPELRKRYGGRVKGLGFSGHHLGIAMDVAAVALGATLIERHFTLDRTWKGTDHAASLEPEGLRKLVRDIRALETAMGSGQKRVLECEVEPRKKLRGS
jgi:sialic acid synthase